MYKCASCGGVAHPATGHYHSHFVLICGPCARSFFKWVQGHTNVKKRVGPKGSKQFVSFYEAAAKEFHPDDEYKRLDAEENLQWLEGELSKDLTPDRRDELLSRKVTYEARITP